MVSKAMCYAEDLKRLPEVLSYACQLIAGGEVVAVAPSQDFVEACFEYGASKAYLCDSECFRSYDPVCVAEGLFRAFELEKPELVFLPATKFGKEVSARLAAKLDAPLAAECRSVRPVDGLVEVERMVFSGNGVATEVLSKMPAVLTLQAGIVEPKKNPRSGPVVRLEVASQPSIKTLEVKRKSESSAIRLEEAERIVAVGRGLQRREDLEMIKQLAELLHAAVGGSRPLAADLGWLSDDQWIGLSGHKVKPKLYVAIGISGQVQHIAGMRDSKVVVAINKDPNAPMAANSDYYVVGDLYKIVPELIRQLKQRS